MCCLGQYIECSGVDFFLVEENIYGPNILANIVKGTQYNRGIWAYKLAYKTQNLENLGNLLHSLLFSWCRDAANESSGDERLWQIKTIVDSLKNTTCTETLLTIFYQSFGNMYVLCALKTKISSISGIIVKYLKFFLNSIKVGRICDCDLHVQTTNRW